MINPKGTIISLSPGDTIVQIVPNFHKNTNSNIIPNIESGYIVPLKFCLIDECLEEVSTETIQGKLPKFCGIMEVGTVFFNDKIRRDILDELYRDNVTFDLYIRSRPCSIEYENHGPRVMKTYHDCYFYRQELSIPEVGLIDTFRYHFTNSNEPWQISQERINEMRPPNQYVYDYAVSKAIKNLQYPINDVCKALNNISEQKTITSSEYVKLVNEQQV